MCILEKSPGTSDDVLGVGGGGLSDLGLVEHAGRVDLVPLFRLPLVLHLAACCGLDFLCGCHDMTPFTARWDSVIVLKAMLIGKSMSLLKNTHSQTFFVYHYKD